MKKRTIAVFCAIIAIFTIAYISDFVLFLSKGIPINIYSEYIFTRISFWGNEDGRYFLTQCELENRTNVFGFFSGHIFFDTKEIYFDSTGNKLCENYYLIDCRDSCPRCLNESVFNCAVLLSNIE